MPDQNSNYLKATKNGSKIYKWNNKNNNLLINN